MTLLETATCLRTLVRVNSSRRGTTIVACLAVSVVDSLCSRGLARSLVGRYCTRVDDDALPSGNSRRPCWAGAPSFRPQSRGSRRVANAGRDLGYTDFSYPDSNAYALSPQANGDLRGHQHRAAQRNRFGDQSGRASGDLDANNDRQPQTRSYGHSNLDQNTGDESLGHPNRDQNTGDELYGNRDRHGYTKIDFDWYDYPNTNRHGDARIDFHWYDYPDASCHWQRYADVDCQSSSDPKIDPNTDANLCRDIRCHWDSYTESHSDSRARRWLADGCATDDQRADPGGVANRHAIDPSVDPANDHANDHANGHEHSPRASHESNARPRRACRADSHCC